MSLTPLFTNTGIAAVTAASNAGLKASITHLAFGDIASTPVASATALGHEVVRVPVDAYQNPDGGSLHLVSVLDDAAPEFTIREIGVILDDGTLLAIWSDPDTPASTKIANTDLTFTFAMTLAGLPEDSVSVTVVDGSGLSVLNHLIRVATVQMEILTRIATFDAGRAADNARMNGLAADIAALTVPANLEGRLTTVENDLSTLNIPPDLSTAVTQLQADLTAISVPDNLLARLESLETTISNLGNAAFKNAGLLEGDLVERVAHGALFGEGAANGRPFAGQFKAWREGDYLRVSGPGAANAPVIRLVPPIDVGDGTN